MAEEIKEPQKNQEPETPKEQAPEDFKKQLEEAEAKKAEYLAGWQRARADFLNYRKDEMERINLLIDYANEEMILKILPLVDNLELAGKNLQDSLKNNEYVKGLLQIKTQFEDFLKAQNVQPIEALGKKFDPNLHEVVAEKEDKTKEPGTIVEETQKGYLIGDRLLRPTKVKVIK
jgi:molecular chaperone GrpE